MFIFGEAEGESGGVVVCFCVGGGSGGFASAVFKHVEKLRQSRGYIGKERKAVAFGCMTMRRYMGRFVIN